MNEYPTLSRLTLENFKAFGERRQHMPIRPITLIYGPNSSGKSSLLQAIALAHEVVVNRAGIVDTKKTQLAGESIDLGGFRQYVHRHEANRDVNLGFGLDIGEPDQVFIEFTIGSETITPSRGIPVRDLIHTKRVTIRLDGRAVLSFQFDPTGYGRVNIQKEHPRISGGIIRAYNARMRQGKLLPIFDIDSLKTRTPAASRSIKLSSYCREYMTKIEKALSEALLSFSYLGPLRYFPNREFSNMPNRGDPNWISGGASAWHRISEQTPLRESINQWLGAKDKLRTPYRLTIRRFVDEHDPNSDIKVPRLVDMQTNTIVSHKDVGIGVSQVLPVLAMVLGARHKLIAIEQPELHLHPAIQAELADLFLESALHRANNIIIETHSENFILRILRRIRESAESGSKDSSHLQVRPDQVSVVYVQPADQGSRVFEIPLTDDGDFSTDWPEGFFPERIKELF